MESINLDRKGAQNRRRLIAFASTGIAVLFLIPAIPMPSASGEPVGAVASQVPMAVEAAIDALGTQVYPSIYGDIAIINDRTQIAVYLTAPTAAIETTFKAIAPSGMLVFRTTPRSEEALYQIHKAVEGQADVLIAEGIRLTEIGPNTLIGKEDVGVVDLTADQAKVLNNLFGAGAINVYNITPEQAADMKSVATRLSDPDAPPYSGGAAVTDYIGGCTTGFGIEIGGYKKLLSAGHCFSVGDDVYNDKADGSGSGDPMGSVTRNGLVFEAPGGFYQGLDSSVINGCDPTDNSNLCGGSNQIFRGPIGSPYKDTVDGKGSWHVGDVVCESGSYGGELCGFTVEQINYDIWADHGYRHYYHVTRAHTNGTNLTPGDSGGPVFRLSNGVQAVGTNTAANGGWGDMWFTGINAILGEWSACLRTSSGCVT
jgi:hypothetical protein